MKKHLVVGLGEIGMPLFKLLSKNMDAAGFDVNPKVMPRPLKEDLRVSILHVCIPFTAKFESHVASLHRRFEPEVIVIHSTVQPGTTQRLQKRLPIPVIYSAARGVHRRMLYDIKRYTKFFAVQPGARNKKASMLFASAMRRCGVKTKKMSTPLTLELAKILCDTSYYGWLIAYAQLTNMIALKNGVKYDEMWEFADEIQKYLGNRPKMFPGVIGGHCVIPNLDLMHDQTLDLIRKINNTYVRKIPNAKSINRRYEGHKKRSHDV